MKPLLRWTLGPCHEVGFDILRRSIKQVKALYGGRFHTVVCYNGRKPAPLDVDEIIEARQGGLRCDPPETSSPGGPAWKLYPARMAPDTHEIIMDNDLVLHARSPKIEAFLEGDGFLITEAFKRSYSPRYEAYIRSGFHINTGIIGLPPGYDFAAEINTVLPHDERWREHFDEQSIVAAIMQHKNPTVLTLTEIAVCFQSYNYGSHGMHFVGANKGMRKYWDTYNETLHHHPVQ
jgi:hypothetical protein